MKGLINGDKRATQSAFNADLRELTFQLMSAKRKAASPHAEPIDLEIPNMVTQHLNKTQKADVW